MCPICRQHHPLERSCPSHGALGLEYVFPIRSEAHGRFPSVLVIEDGDDQRVLLAALLEDAGFEVRACANAIEGLQLLAGWQPSAIVLDWYLPLLGGEAFVHSVRREAGLAKLPIVVLTGAPHIDVKGVDAVLRKPADISELLVTLERLTASEGGALAEANVPGQACG